jgi:hypothetical protein
MDLLTMVMNHAHHGKICGQCWRVNKNLQLRIFPSKKIVTKGGDNSFGTKQNVRSSWSDSIVGVESPTLSHCRKKSATCSQNFLRHEDLPSSIARSVEKCKEPSIARKEKIKIPIVGCTMRNGYVMGDEFHPLVNQQASMPSVIQRRRLLLVTKFF